MTPDSLNPPGPSIKDQNKLLCVPNNHDSTSFPCRAFFQIHDQRQSGDIRFFGHDDQKGYKRVFHGESSSTHQVYNNLSFVSSHEPVMADPSSACDHNLSMYKIELQEENKSSYESARYMNSKIRLTRKMMSSSTNPSSYKSNSINTRVCADCNTSSTPLWRTGPNGPKTLCNACGIRQRKARKAMAEASNNFTASTDASIASKTKVHHKEKNNKKKNKCKASPTSSVTTTRGTSQGERKLHFKDFDINIRNNSPIQLLRDEEVAQAALLLMDLSSGFVHF
ncbi:hypothetical protein TanjilG_12444 [Lupinus angustifolius]|uniref:GATA-type domain-containing protein n=1 Tax=Lupinus angustifolius TaxID=3871 RepID=A0A4P1QYM0_LUPAN|nr:PREDICTED: GATA transcription factor 21-like [Lupinus angustifolius]OIV97687.1 hypothetical protein TanjilG_12444 [Lupinus angustifolius]